MGYHCFIWSTSWHSQEDYIRNIEIGKIGKKMKDFDCLVTALYHQQADQFVTFQLLISEKRRARISKIHAKFLFC
jgi:hypothetical protein